jgi:hypothetical protein
MVEGGENVTDLVACDLTNVSRLRLAPSVSLRDNGGGSGDRMMGGTASGWHEDQSGW